MSNLRTFDNRLQHKVSVSVVSIHLVIDSMQVNVLSQAVHGRKLLPHHQPPAAFTGELYGLEYLYSQTGAILPGALEVDKQIDEGFCDAEQVEACMETKDHGSDYSEDISTFAPPSDSEDEEEVRWYS